MRTQIHLTARDLENIDEFGLTYNLGQAHKKMLLKQSGIMKRFGLTARQALIIAYLATHPRETVTQKTLEDHLHLTNPTITVMIRAMMKKGLIYKERVPEDGRKHRLLLTDKARRVEEKSQAAARELDERFYQGVSEKDLKIFRGVLGQILKNLDMVGLD